MAASWRARHEDWSSYLPKCNDKILLFRCSLSSLLLAANIGVGVQYNRNEKLNYNIRAKKSFPVTADGVVSFNVKGRCYADEDFKEVKYSGGADITWNIFNVKKDQDLRLKIGYDVHDKIPYLQIRENNWTFNADINRRWNVRYDL
ncbi:hypothetical protein RD792_011216 [Penstemon davidsonii]|uniref:Uncharacterized protein n=1 Tax=Penstemon davidsonii TaxID=160366 RepID=A0ABR0D5C7_9LAMI|nr:hypothetical protein RD792_011216 [Penstemon davidsonii]